MDKVRRHRELIEDLLREYSPISHPMARSRSRRSSTRIQGHYQLVNVGWHGQHGFTAASCTWISRTARSGFSTMAPRKGSPIGWSRPGCRRDEIVLGFQSPFQAQVHGFRRRIDRRVARRLHRSAKQRSSRPRGTALCRIPRRQRGAAMARRSKPSPSPAWLDDLPVLERRLDNGLRALVLPRRRAPIVVCDLYYPVGSFDEPPGQSGLAHFVEHMLFKGTERFPKGQIDRLVLVGGGPVQRRDRRGQHALLVRVPVRSLGAGPGDRGRPDARARVRPARGRGSSGA